DGIRDFHVTGVQTCALPISASKLTNQNYELKLLMRQGTTIDTLSGHLKLIEAYEFPDFFDDENKQMFIFLYNFDFTSKNQVHGRSEERRVGKTYITSLLRAH